WILAAVGIATTLLPLSRNMRWWVRMWDFPRIHIAALSLGTAIYGSVLGGPWILLASMALVLCFSYQTFRVFPYTRFARTQIEMTQAPHANQISLIAVNVLMENEDHAKLRSLIDREDPDVLFLMETDEIWENALVDQLARYPTVVRHPMSDHYGLLFATRLKVHAADTHFLSDDDTPAVLADLECPANLRRFFFVGLHPRPPLPGTDAVERDEQIKKSARIADHAVRPVVVMGDFNDVAWSTGSEHFKEYGGFKDPRIGRGMLPSFDARSWFVRLPIDQLLVTEGVQLVSFDRLEPVGSDHFPMKAVIAVEPKL
ncbi:MAG: endonuclease/exonuclease/phosphatase family protein, partial [Paracoccaceae bacterium]